MICHVLRGRAEAPHPLWDTSLPLRMQWQTCCSMRGRSLGRTNTETQYPHRRLVYRLWWGMSTRVSSLGLTTVETQSRLSKRWLQNRGGCELGYALKGWTLLYKRNKQKRKKILSRATAWMNFVDIVLSETSQLQKDKHSMIHST